MGQPSLFQRIFSLIANGDIRARNKDIKRLRQSLGHEDIADILEKCAGSRLHTHRGLMSTFTDTYTRPEKIRNRLASRIVR